MTSRLTDAELVARCREGDEAAWAELVERFSRYVYAIAVQGFRLSEQDAEDVFQEVFARTYERLDRLRDDAAVRPWLAQLTRNLCVDRLRDRARVEPTEDIEAARTRRSPSSTSRWTSARRWRPSATPAPTSSTASSARTRATGRSASGSSSPPGRSPAVSRAVS